MRLGSPLLVVLSGFLASSASFAEAKDATALLDEALRLRYEAETLQEVDLTLRGPSGVLGDRSLEIATKLYDDRLYVLGRFVAPQRLRGSAFLAIEGADSSDYFVYLPAFRKVRRVASFQRSDPWFETDLSFEDVERHYLDDYRIEGSTADESQGEPAIVISTSPRYGSRFERVRFFVAREDCAILRMEYFAAGRDSPSKVIVAPRSSIVHEKGSLVPRKIIATNLDHGTTTTVDVRKVSFDPQLRREFFSASRLELRTKLPFTD